MRVGGVRGGRMLWVAFALLTLATVLVLAALWMAARGAEELAERESGEWL